MKYNIFEICNPILLPICDCGTIVLWRSQRGEYSRPRSASRSPCTKNSSIHLDVHWWCRSHRFAGWETSQECNTKQRTFVLSKLQISKQLGIMISKYRITLLFRIAHFHEYISITSYKLLKFGMNCRNISKVFVIIDMRKERWNRCWLSMLYFAGCGT